MSGSYSNTLYFRTQNMSKILVIEDESALQKSLGDLDLQVPTDELQVSLIDEGIDDATPLLAYFNAKKRELVELVDPLSQKTIWKK